MPWCIDTALVINSPSGIAQASGLSYFKEQALLR